MPKAKDFDAALQYIKNKLPQQGFFSTLDELIRASPQKQMPAAQWANYLKPGATLTRGGINFPLKAEEMQYSGLPDLFHQNLDPTPIPKDTLLNYLHQNRKGLGVTSYVDQPRGASNRYPAESATHKGLRGAFEDSDDSANEDLSEGLNDIRTPHALTAADFGTHKPPKIDESKHGEYAHTPGIPNTYEESVTTSPDFGEFQSHFSPKDLSWSRTTRHWLPPEGPMPEAGPKPYLGEDPQGLLNTHMNFGTGYDPSQGAFHFGPPGVDKAQALSQLRASLAAPKDTRTPGKARIIEEIQSDRHQAAADKVFLPTRAQTEEKGALEQKLEDIRKQMQDDKLPYDDYTDQRRNLQQQIADLKSQSQARRGYSTAADRELAKKYASLPYDEQEKFLETLPYETRMRMDYMPHNPPDSPFKDPKDYGLLEIKKQLLNSVEQGDDRLALASGKDNADRYSPGDSATRDQGMRYMYDTVYPSAMKKLAAQYGIPFGETKIPIKTDAANNPVNDLYRELSGDETDNLEDLLVGDKWVSEDGETPSYDLHRQLADRLHQMIPEDQRRPVHDLARQVAHQHFNEAQDSYEEANMLDEPPESELPATEEANRARKEARQSHNMGVSQLEYLSKEARKTVPDKVDKTFQNSMQITPEIRERIRRIGIPIWALTGATGAGPLFQNDQVNANPVEDQAMSNSNGYSKGGNVTFALRRLLAQIRDAPELQDAAKAAGTFERGEAVLPKPDTSLPPPTTAHQMATQMMENGRPGGTRTPATPEQLVRRLRGQDLVEPTELNHLLYADPETNAAINAYQGEMDKAVVDQRPVNPAIREQLAAILNKHAQAPQAAPLDQELAEGGPVAFDPIMSARERLGYADGGSIKKVADITDKLGGQKRFTVGVAKQLYGLDKDGKPAFGGRAWTQGQGGTPLGILDEITSAPHSLIGLAKTIRGFDPLRSRDPTYGKYQRGIDDFLDKMDPQWSKDASDRLDLLREAVNSQAGIGDPHGIKDHMLDAAASMVTPIPMTKAGEDASLLKRALEMTTPLRPRTAKNFATDTAVLGGTTAGIDALVERLAKLKAQREQAASMSTADPTQFSADMGVHPAEGTIYPQINRSAGMQPLPGGGYGIPPETF